MKIQLLIPILFLVGFFTVTAQTNNTNTSVLLTTNQAQLLAIRLVNEQYKEIYESQITNKYNVFDTNSSDLMIEVGGIMYGTGSINGTNYIQRIQIGTRFEDGHWISILVRGKEFTVVKGTVEIAPDGSTNSVSLRYERRIF